MENPLYQLYLQNAAAFATGYWLLGLMATILPLLLITLTLKLGKFANDGLPENANTMLGIIVSIIFSALGVIVGAITLVNAIPATFTPELWALSKVASCLP